MLLLIWGRDESSSSYWQVATLDKVWVDVMSKAIAQNVQESSLLLINVNCSTFNHELTVRSSANLTEMIFNISLLLIELPFRIYL